VEIAATVVMAKPVAKNEIDAYEREIVARLDSLSNQSAESLRNTRREFSKKLKLKASDFVLELATRLVDRSQFPYRFMAYELILKHKQALERVDAKMLTRLGKGLDSWVAVDTFSCYVSGPVWRAGQVEDKLIESWARSKDRWWRRASLVSTVPLNLKSQGGSGDVARTIGICEMLVKDRDDMVVKALSWALRELAKREPKVVLSFLEQNAQYLAPRVRREVGNKLSTGLKNPVKNQE
jgi:3-methyladenine DNA glycosylase AlkD